MSGRSPAWERQYSEGARERKGFISYWHGVFEAPVAAPDPIQKDTAESLLRKLIEQNDPLHIPAAYILAVMLERKRLLKVKEQLVRDGRRVFIYEHPATGDLFTIVDPALQLNQLEQVQQDVAQFTRTRPDTRRQPGNFFPQRKLIRPGCGGCGIPSRTRPSRARLQCRYRTRRHLTSKTSKPAWAMLFETRICCGCP